MRFVCEICQTRYIIPDERARGRVLKVRCKKCGNVIILKSEAAASPESVESAPAPSAPSASTQTLAARAGEGRHDRSDEATQMVDADALRKLRDDSRPAKAPPPPADQGSADPAEWHAILQGKQIGPLPMSGLIEKMLGGEMNARTFVWKDGLGDWKRAEEVADVARWLPARPSPTPPPQRIPQAPAKGKPTVAPSPTSRAPLPQPVAVAPATDPAASSLTSPTDSAERFFSGEDADDVPAAAVDPFSLVGDAPGLSQPKPGEVTKFFITQAGVSKRRSPWRVAIYAGGGAVLLVLALTGLSRLGVDVPLLPQGSGQGPRIFNGAHRDSKLRNLLYGAPKAASAPKVASGPSAGPRPAVAPPAEQGPLAKKAAQHVDQLATSDKEQLAQLYAKTDLNALKLKPSTSATAPVIDRPDAPLTADQVGKTVARFQNGYTACIERELKRNPNFEGGKIRIVTTIMSSGLVRQAQIQSDDARVARNVNGGPLGGCLTDQTRRMVFPSFQGEPFDAEIPLVLRANM